MNQRIRVFSAAVGLQLMGLQLALPALSADTRYGSSAAAAGPRTATLPTAVEHTTCRTVDVGGVKVFYREAGRPSSPTLVLLHGNPSSSFMFRDLIPRLAKRLHVIAPDYPGFGYSDSPAP